MKIPPTPPLAPLRDVPPDTPPVFKRGLEHLLYTRGKHWDGSTQYDRFVSLAMAVRDAAFERMLATQGTYEKNNVKRVYYLSLEFLTGKMLRRNMINLGLYEGCRAFVEKMGGSLDRVFEAEPEPGLGNGGLGRLAACYMESAATLGLPVYGYSIRYECGIFEQNFQGGRQVEQPEYWLRFGSPWEVMRPDLITEVRLFGRIEHRQDKNGRYSPQWTDAQVVLGLPFDYPIIGYGNNTVNILRLWSARASACLNLETFNRGGYIEAVRERILSETISKVLYPADQTIQGQALRLIQQYFFTACTLADVLRRFDRRNDDISRLPDKAAVQLNDTHPSIAVPELMRLLVDERGLPWEQAWEITTAVFAYTNHTLLPEALEIWPVALLGRILPRHLEIIYEINRRFLEQVGRTYPGNEKKKRTLSLVQENDPKSIRMAHLAIVGSHTVNGVAELHGHLLRERVVPDFAELWPEKFTHVTNGITPRRWLLSCNRELATAVTRRIGDGWVTDLDELEKLAPFADDPEFKEEFRSIRKHNKDRLVSWIRDRMGVTVSTDALYDTQVKRLHEYKRQLLNILHVVMLYHEIIDNPGSDRIPRLVLFGAKAAPSYHRAKLIIKLINDVASVVNNDDRVGDRLKVLFLPNYCVSLAEIIIPASDLSEQISTAGMEASGTGNMKFALNGALTIGTLDGANIEIRECVGGENFFLFGLTAEEVKRRREEGYNPRDIYDSHEAVRRAVDAVADGGFNLEEPYLFREVRDWLLQEGDQYMLLADIEPYIDAQQRVEALWKDPGAWTKASVLNMARVGKFSSDRSIREYAERIWKAKPVLVEMAEPLQLLRG